jgi:hypothetical protein
VLFNLPEYRVVDAVDRPDGAREVVIEGTWAQAACPGCGVLSGRVHQRTRQRLRDVPVAGPVEVVLVKRRFACREMKLAISVPPEVAEAARAAVTAGEAESVSAYFTEAASQAQRRRADLARIRSALGESTPEAIAWAERVLGAPIGRKRQDEEPAESYRRAG